MSVYFISFQLLSCTVKCGMMLNITVHNKTDKISLDDLLCYKRNKALWD